MKVLKMVAVLELDEKSNEEMLLFVITISTTSMYLLISM